MPSGANNQRKQLAMLAAAKKNEEVEEDPFLQTRGEKSNIITSQNNYNRSSEPVHKNEVSEKESKDLNIVYDQDVESSDYENSDDEAETDGEVEHSDNITEDIDDDDEIGEESRNLPNLGTLIDIPSVSSFHSQRIEVLKTRSSVWNCCGLLDLFKGSQ